MKCDQFLCLQACRGKRLAESVPVGQVENTCYESGAEDHDFTDVHGDCDADHCCLSDEDDDRNSEYDNEIDGVDPLACDDEQIRTPADVDLNMTDGETPGGNGQVNEDRETVPINAGGSGDLANECKPAIGCHCNEYR